MWPKCGGRVCAARFSEEAQATLRDIETAKDGSRNYQEVEMKKPESYASVWDAADTPGQAANLRARAELMQQIAAFVNGRAGRSRRRHWW
jgi:hypothetical protein